jgi:hypothetical protein
MYSRVLLQAVKLFELTILFHYWRLQFELVAEEVLHTKELTLVTLLIPTNFSPPEIHSFVFVSIRPKTADAVFVQQT